MRRRSPTADPNREACRLDLDPTLRTHLLSFVRSFALYSSPFLQHRTAAKEEEQTRLAGRKNEKQKKERILGGVRALSISV